MALDRRVRLKPRVGAESYVYGDAEGPGLLSILRNTDGLMWPTTPIINVSHNVNYEKHQTTHSLSPLNTFQSTGSTEITVSGDFYVGNATEAYYLLASLHFLRTVTKMDFGRTSNTAGAAPPVLLFSAYGRFMFNDVPVIVKSCSMNFRDDVDYVQVPVEAVENARYFTKMDSKSPFYDVFHEKNDGVWVPQVLNINVMLEQQPTIDYISKEFNLNQFKRGSLLTRGGFI